MKTSGFDRREILKSGVALSAAAVAGGAFADGAGSGQAAGHLALERFVVDRRFPAALAAGEAAARAGVPVAVVEGDLSRLWYDDLDLAWRQAPMTLAGVTGPEGLFVLETLAADRGMRVVFRGHHRTAEEGRAHHRLRGPGRLVVRLSDCVSASADARSFGADAFNVLAGCPAGRDRIEALEVVAPMALTTNERRSDTLDGGRRGDAGRPDGEMVTWVIAPRGAATAVPPA